MSKKLFDDYLEENVGFKTDNEYANKYNTWREKEELHKLQTKYGENATLSYNDNQSSSSSDDDEVAVEFTENVEKEFYKTLALLKKKDPKIYDKSVTFFDNTNSPNKTSGTKKNKAVYLNDYERNRLLESKALTSSDDEDEYDSRLQNHSPTYVEEQQRLKESFKTVLNSDEEEEENWGGIFQKRNKSCEENKREEEDYKVWLKGQKEDIDDRDIAEQLKPLKEFWTDPKLDKNEQFLRDYILHKRFLEENDEDHIPTYEEIVHDSDENLSEDEKAIETQEEFEHKYNFRFEEPDQEFIKRYPRTMENSLRKTDDRRKLKRAEIKERKEQEKKQKNEELKQLKALKRKEIEEKIERLREITGDNSLGFQDVDLEGDFDPEAYDKRMQELFNDEYYKDEEVQKPECDEMDEELEIENWDKWHKEKYEQGSSKQQGQNSDETEAVPHCEDEDFNMDCDYDSASVQKELIDNSKSKRKRRKRDSKFAKAVSAEKPIFDPSDKTYQQYLDEYYQLDYEDIIGDVPCRFKYRSVVPNDFGLSIEEILMANDRELNKWCSLKKAIQHRPEHIEKYEVIAYQKKGQNENLKRKALPSLFQVENDTEATDIHSEPNAPETEEVIAPSEETKEVAAVPRKKTKRKKGKKNSLEVPSSSNVDSNTKPIEEKKKNVEKDVTISHEDANAETPEIAASSGLSKDDFQLSKCGSALPTKKKKRKNEEPLTSSVTKKQKVSTKRKNVRKNAKKVNSKMFKTHSDKKIKLSDARLEAFGINPKKYKNKMKYGAGK